MKSILQTFKILTLALVLSFGLSYALAWTAPTEAPPDGNIAAPVNTGSLTSLQSILGKVIIGMSTNSSMLTLDARATTSAATTAPFRNIFQVASQDTTGPLSLRFGIKTDATPANRYGAIEVKDGAGAVYQDLSLQPNGGNVGMGTTAPTTKLDVVGGIKASGTIETSGIVSGNNVMTNNLDVNVNATILAGSCYYRFLSDGVHTNCPIIEDTIVPCGAILNVKSIHPTKKTITCVNDEPYENMSSIATNITLAPAAHCGSGTTDAKCEGLNYGQGPCGMYASISQNVSFTWRNKSYTGAKIQVRANGAGTGPVLCEW